MRAWSAIAAACVLVGCGSATDSEISIVVSAASSLNAAFTEIAEAFEAQNPGVGVRLNFAGSSALREQVLEGAAIDVFASADFGNVSAALGVGGGIEQAFARNTLVVGVPAENPGAVVGVRDLAREELLVGVCAGEVPCGRLAEEVLTLAGIEAAVDTFEPSARALVSKLEIGELDVGLVYLSDVSASTSLIGFRIAGDSPTAEYYIAPLSPSDRAGDFVAFVLSPAGQQILQAFGFTAP